MNMDIQLCLSIKILQGIGNLTSMQLLVPQHLGGSFFATVLGMCVMGLRFNMEEYQCQ